MDGPSSPAPSSTLRPWIAPVGLAVLAVLLYAPGWNAPFVFDDFESLVDNPSLKPPRNWGFVLVYSFRPLVNLVFAFEYALFGAVPWPYHVLCVLLHALNVVLVYRLVQRLSLRAGPVLSGAGTSLAVCVCVLFAVHPLQSQSVAYISQRSELLAAAFVLGALLTFIQHVEEGRRGWPVRVAVLTLLGVASKETAAVAPLIFLMYDRLFGRPAPDASTEEKSTFRARMLRFHLPVMVVVGVGVVARLVLLLTVEAPRLPRGFGLHVLMQADVVTRYVRLLLLPFGQSVVHDVSPRPELQGVRIALLVFWALVLPVALWLVRRRAPLAVFGFAWFLVALLPSTLVPLMEPMAEHRVYLPSVGWWLGLSATLAQLLAGGTRRWWVWVGGSVLALVAVGLSIATLARVGLWRNPTELWKDAVEKAPDVWATRYALGDAYREAGDCARAIPEYSRATSLDPRDARAYLNLGICLAQTGKLLQAEGAFRRAGQLAPRDVRVLNNLVNVYILKGDLTAARGKVREALALDPRNTQTQRLARMLSVNPTAN